MEWRNLKYPLTPVSLLAIQGPCEMHAQATSKGLLDHSPIRLCLYTNSDSNCQDCFKTLFCPVYHQFLTSISIHDVLPDMAGRTALPSSME